MDDCHITDQELLLEADGELSYARAARVRQHLATCWTCRSRKVRLEQTIADFVELHRGLDKNVPPIDGPKALLAARLAQAAAEPAARPWFTRLNWAPNRALAAAVAVLFVTVLLFWSSSRSRTRPVDDFAPNSAWTPGAVETQSREAVCSAAQSAEVRQVAASVAQQVFNLYGIHDPQPRSYEVDYLIPPTLGGSEDPRNLWPQPYSSGVWTARVKDALEDRLHSLVCDGKLDLATAQHDLARNWISAYKKYFRTDHPLLNHVAFVKDPPWE